MMVELSVLIEQFESRCHVRLQGELDMSTAWRLREQLETTWGVAEIDCSELAFVDSSGLALLIERRGRDGALVLIHPSTQLLNILTICGLSEMFEIRVEDESPKLPEQIGLW